MIGVLVQIYFLKLSLLIRPLARDLWPRSIFLSVSGLNLYQMI